MQISIMMDGSTPIWQLTVDQLNELIQSIIPIPTQEIEKDYYLNSKEAKEYLKVSISTLARWKKEKYLKCEKLGGIIRYKKSELDRLLKTKM